MSGDEGLEEKEKDKKGGGTISDGSRITLGRSFGL